MVDFARLFLDTRSTAGWVMKIGLVVVLLVPWIAVEAELAPPRAPVYDPEDASYQDDQRSVLLLSYGVQAAVLLVGWVGAHIVRRPRAAGEGSVPARKRLTWTALALVVALAAYLVSSMIFVLKAPLGRRLVRGYELTPFAAPMLDEEYGGDVREMLAETAWKPEKVWTLSSIQHVLAALMVLWLLLIAVLTLIPSRVAFLIASRHLEAPPPPPPPGAKLVLFLTANSTEDTRLHIDTEVGKARAELDRGDQGDLYAVRFFPKARASDVSREILRQRPAIVQFSGHGTEDGCIILESDDGKETEVRPEALAGLFRVAGKSVECVVLNACYSKAQAEAIAGHVQHVVGVDNQISDDAAIAFSVGFYQALGTGAGYEQAYDLGCVQYQMSGRTALSEPVLFIKPDRDEKGTEADSRGG